MKGQVLTYTDTTGTGVISGEDGKRYGFSKAEWKSERLPTAGAQVDFEPRESEAAAIYVLVQPPAASINLEAVGASPTARRALNLLRTKLEAPLALAALIVCLLSFLAISHGGVTRGFSLFAAGDALTTLNAMLPLSQRGNAEEIAMMGGLLTPRWAAPILAAILLAGLWLGWKTRLLTIAAGAAAIIGFLTAFALSSAMGSAAADANLLRPAPELKVGLGAWLLLLIGAAMIATALGKLRSPFASSDP